MAAKKATKAARNGSKMASSSSSSSSYSTGQTSDSSNSDSKSDFKSDSNPTSNPNSNFNSSNSGSKTNSDSNSTNVPEKLIIHCTTSKRKTSQKFFCPRPGCGSHFSALVFLKTHDRKHRKVQAYRCLFPDPKTGAPCHQRASVLGNLMTHVHKIHNRRKKFQYSYLKQFIEEDQKLLDEEEALFAGAELRWNGVKGGKIEEEEDLVEVSVEKDSVEDPVEDPVEDSVEDPVEDSVEDSLKKEEKHEEKDSIIIKDDSKKEPEDSGDLGDDDKDEEEEEEGEDDGSYAFLLAKYHRLKRRFPFPCRLGRFKDVRFCELRFAEEGDRVDHEREHLGVRPFQCLWPTKKSKTGDGNDKEKKTEDGFCGRHFLRRQFAREHIKDEHGFGELDEDELDQFINVQEDLLLA